MELSHPLDAALRERLKTDTPDTQAKFAKAIGRSAGWLNKYMHGAGNATIDDVIRIVALLIGVETRPLSELERQLLKACQGFQDEADLRDLIAYVEHRVKLAARRGGSTESSAPAAHTPPATIRRAPGKRQAGKG